MADTLNYCLLLKFATYQYLTIYNITSIQAATSSTCL